MRQKRHIWPRVYSDDEAPIFGAKTDDSVLFRQKELRIGQKKLWDYARLIRHRQIQDAIDWMESLGQMKSAPILDLLRRSHKSCVERHQMDSARLFIFEAHGERGPFIKKLKKHARAHFGIVKSPRNGFHIKVRQMPLEEYFHRLYIYNKVPRTLASDMRLALHQQRVSPQTQKEWAPYLCAHSRFWHRKELKWQDCTRQFDYYKVRAEWIQRYKANLLRASTEAREARGLPPLAVIE